MTRVLVLSDTHLEDESDLLQQLIGHIRSADLILHAGDHTGTRFYTALQSAAGDAELIAVHGNMDARRLQSELPDKILFEREGVRIGLTHGWGASGDLPERILGFWSEERPDVMVFGHSHRVYNDHRQGALLFNPGSPTEPVGPTPTVGWLEIERGECKAGLIRLSQAGKSS